MARQPQPVSGTPTMSTQGRAAPQAEEEKVPFFQRPGVGNALDSLAIALQGMTINPNQALMQLSANRIQGRRKQAQTKAQQNRTLEALKNMGAPPQIIQMAEAGYGREAMSQMAQMARGPEYRQITGEEAAAMGLDPTKSYNVGLDGKVTGIGGGNTEINMPGELSGEDSLRKKLLENQGKTLNNIVEAGRVSSQVVPDLEALRALAEAGPSGPIQGRFAEMFPEFNDVAAARQAIIRRVAPQMRAEGSGSTSDVEYAGMVESLGRLTNSPEANMAIADMMIAKSRLDQERAALVQQYTNESIDYATLTSRLQELDRVSIMPDSLKRIINNQGTTQGGTGSGATSTGQATHRFNPQTGQVEEIQP